MQAKKSAGDAMYRDFFGDDGGVNEREFWGTDEGGGVPRKGMPSKKRGPGVCGMCVCACCFCACACVY